MSSDDEKYLDSLLNSAKSNNKDPQSALSRMSSKGVNWSDSGEQDTAPGDIGALVDNANGNEELAEIGDALNKLDSNEFVDDGLASLLDGIEKPTDPSIPQFSVGGSVFDTRDPEEIALDEAIADAERMDAEALSGKFDESPTAPPEAKPLVEADEGDDALLEMAPEVVLPEDNSVTIESGEGSDASETPEEILTDLLDDMPGSSLTDIPEDASIDSLSDVLDNIQEEDSKTMESVEEENPIPPSDIDNMSLEDIEAMMDSGLGTGSIDEVADVPIPEVPEEPTDIGDMEVASQEQVMDEAAISDAVQESGAVEEDQIADNLDDLMNDMAKLGLDDITGNADEGGSEEAAPENSDLDAAPEMALEEPEADMDLSGFTLDGGDPVEHPEMENQDGGDISLDDLALTEDGGGEVGETPSEDAGVSPEIAEASEGGEAATSDENSETGGDEFNLEDIEASLDDLLGEDTALVDSVEGEVAEIAAAADIADESQEGSSGSIETEEETSMEDLDALMNSLANDEIEDLESTASKDEEAGVSQEEEIPKEDILDALTEEGFDEGAGEPSLDDLASIEERSSSGGGGGGGGGRSSGEGNDEGKGKKKKKGGLGAFFKNLFAVLTAEDEETNEGLASLTDENATVLKELGEEGDKPKKEKKKKEKKPKKEKPKKEPKPKKEKPPKPKKEKKPKPPKDPGEPEKAISPKKVAISGLFAASIGILVMIPVLVLPDRIANERAETAYTHREYTTAYKMLYGKELTEDQSIVYEQSRVLAWAERYLTGYQNYIAMNMQEEALDMLLMAMRNKEDLLEEAVKYGVEIQVQSVYDSIESLLSQNYGLSEDGIKEVNSIKKEREYTIRLLEICGVLES